MIPERWVDIDGALDLVLAEFLPPLRTFGDRIASYLRCYDNADLVPAFLSAIEDNQTERIQDVLRAYLSGDHKSLDDRYTLCRAA